MVEAKVKKILLFLLSLGLCGCAGIQPMVDEYNTTTGNYFANPKDRIMITIVGSNGGFAKMQCHCSTGSLADAGSNSSSFEDYTPFARVADVSEGISEIRKQYNTASKAEKEQVKLYLSTVLPHVVYTCQNQGYGGLIGKIYFDGKEVSSDVADIDYAVINLSYAIPVEVVLKK